MKLTKRDSELLNGLSKYGMFSTKQIVELYFKGTDSATVLRRLRIIEAENYLRRVGKLETNEVLWGVTSKGGEHTGAENFKTHWSKSMLEHDHKLVSLRLVLEKLGVLNSWTAEHQIRSMIYKKYSLREAKNKLIPDGLMEASIKNYKESMAIELELNLKNTSKYQKIIYGYQGKDGLHAVWYIVSSQTIMNCLKNCWSKSRSSYSKLKVYFSFLEDVKNLGVEAKMFGLDSTYLIKNYFDLQISMLQGAQLAAQVVSTPCLNLNDRNMNLSSELHTPLVGFNN
jgi:hypothetical protein